MLGPRCRGAKQNVTNEGRLYLAPSMDTCRLAPSRSRADTITRQRHGAAKTQGTKVASCHGWATAPSSPACPRKRQRCNNALTEPASPPDAIVEGRLVSTMAYLPQAQDTIAENSSQLCKASNCDVSSKLTHEHKHKGYNKNRTSRLAPRKSNIAGLLTRTARRN